MKTRTGFALLAFIVVLPAALLVAAITLVGDAVAAVIGRGLALWARLRRASTDSPARDNTHASIVIINWNGRDLLAQGLPSVLAAAAQAGGEHEIIVVDNGSSDGSAEFVCAAFPTVRLVTLDHNLGFSAGNNAGVRAAHNDIVVLVNNDMVVESGFLSPLLRPFADQRVFAVSAQIFMEDPNRQRVESGLTCGEMCTGQLRAWHGDIGAAETAERPCLWAGGGSAAFDRRRSLDLGGFRPLYAPFYVEDVDLSYRAWARGWTVLLAPQSVVYHRHRSSTTRLGNDYVEQALAKNQRLFVWHSILDVAWTLQSIVRLPGDLATAVCAGDRNERAAIAWAMRQLPATLAYRWAAAVRRLASAPGAIADGRRTRPTDRDIFRIATSRYHYKERFLPPPPSPGNGRKRILVVCPYLPAPPAHGGAVRMLSLIKHLSLSSDVDVLSFIDSDAERAFSPQIEPHCRRLCLVLRRQRSARPNPLRDRSRHIEEFDTPEMRQALLDMMGDEDYHVLLVEYTQLALYHPGSRRCLTVLDEVDVFFRSFFRRQIAGAHRPAVQDIVDYLKLVRFEVQSCRCFDWVLAMSEADSAYLAGYAPQKRSSIAVIANGVDTDYFTPAPAWPGERELLFIGSHRHTPNQDGVSYFLRDVFPLIQRRIPDVRLTIAGDGAWAAWPDVATQPAATATGFVEDIRPYLARCAVSIVPILSGSGTRIKILDSLAAGIPVVSTTLGCEGIAVRAGEHVLIADSPAAFAAAVVHVLQDAALAESLRRNGRRLVEERYAWHAIAAQLDALLTASLLRSSR